MKITENLHIARAVLAVAIIASILISGGGALSKIKSVATDNFYAQDGISFDLIRRGESAQLLATLAQSYSLDESVISRVNSAAQVISDADQSIGDRGKAHTELSLAVDDLYTKLTQANLSEADENYAYSLYKEIQSRAQIIDHSDYDTLAADYNKEASGFPAGLISKLTGLGSLDSFR